MVRKVLQVLNKNKMLNDGEHVIVGLSGGADSVALLHFFLEIKNLFHVTLTAVHVNHGLRGEESDGDEAYVRELCQRLHVPLDVYQYNIEEEAKKIKLTLEEAGRQIRYQCFNETLQKAGADKIAVAHNMNDNAETVLMRIFRGTGLKGMEGIPAVRQYIIRPFIETSRNEIERYCEEKGISYRTDSTNEKKFYTRNKIRLDMIPYIEKEINAGVVENINRMSTLVKEENHYLNHLAEEAYKKCLLQQYGMTDKNGIAFTIETFKGYPTVLIKRMIRIGFSKYCLRAPLTPSKI